MAIFDDKSVQGIIDKITAELTCIGSITDKSIQGIIDKATAAGITDKSIQGIIDKLTSFSCIPADPVYTEFCDEHSCGTEISWAVPAGVTKLKVFCIGGGGGGGGTLNSSYAYGGGGGGVWGGYVKLPDTISEFKIIIGCGGTSNDQTLGTASYIKVNGTNYCVGSGGKVLHPGTGGGQYGGSGGMGGRGDTLGVGDSGLTGGGAGTAMGLTSYGGSATQGPNNFGGGGGGSAFVVWHAGMGQTNGGADYDGTTRATPGHTSGYPNIAAIGGDGSRGGGGGGGFVGGYTFPGTGGTGGKGVVRIYYGEDINAIPDEDCDLIIT